MLLNSESAGIVCLRVTEKKRKSSDVYRAKVGTFSFVIQFTTTRVHHSFPNKVIFGEVSTTAH